MVPESAPNVYRALHQAIKNGLVKSAHDLCEGGLAVTAAEMCLGGRLVIKINPESPILFREVNGCFLVEVAPGKASAFEAQFEGLPVRKIGKVISDPVLRISDLDIPLEDLLQAFNNPSHL
jgi:phosphoribosylformylglycinamidine synthase